MRRGAFDPILFDLDGTVIDSVRLIRESHRHAVRTVLGHEIPDAALLANVGRPLVDQMHAFSPDDVDDLVREFREWNLRMHDELLTPYEGMDDLLADLRAVGRRLGIVTSKNRPTVRRSFEVVPVRDRFEVVVDAEDSDVHKPDPAPLLVAIERFGGGTPASHCYVGDAPFDIRAARAAGITAIGVTWGFFPRDALEAEGADVVVDTIPQLRDVLLG